MTTPNKWPRKFTATNPKLKPVYFRALVSIAGGTAAALARRLDLAPSTVQMPCRDGGSLELLKRYSTALNIDFQQVMLFGKKLELAEEKLESEKPRL